MATRCRSWSKRPRDKPLLAERLSLTERLIADIGRGSLPFDEFVDRALYDPEHGFYAVHGQAGGRRGDFVTSVEVGPLFAQIVADWLDARWLDLGSPAPFLVSEVGAGVGTLFRGINRAAPACFTALEYTLVERPAAKRAMHQSLPTQVWRSAAEMPAGRQHVVLANELLDNLAFGIAERVEAGWARVDVVVRHDELALRIGDADPDLDWLHGLAPSAEVGSRVPISRAASEWVRVVRSRTDHLLVFDYGASTAALVARGQDGWLRTYADHRRGSDPLEAVGQLDITHDVAIDQLPNPDRHMAQADWLRSNGIEARVETARAIWTERAHIGDLQAIAARSAIGEAEALTDPAGLGAFRVLEWGS